MGHFDPMQDRKKPWIETPLIESVALSKTAGCPQAHSSNGNLNAQNPRNQQKLKPTRGIGNLIFTSLKNPENKGKELHFYSSSGGNAGLAAVTAARELDCRCTVVVPHSTKPLMISKLREAGATDVIQYGASWFEADSYLRQNFIDNQDLSGDQPRRNIYVPPFDHPGIWNGAATMVSEIARQLPPREAGDECSFPADAIVCSIGGGGLFNGVVNGLEKYIKSNASEGAKKNVQVLAVETAGADSLSLALRNGRLQSLPAITSLATSLGALCVAPQTLKNAQSPPAGIDVKNVVGTDAEAAQGVIRIADELRLQVELACAISVEVAVKKLKETVPSLRPDSRVVVILCGGSNITAEMITDYRQRLQNGWQ
ncbi:l-serine dehydratase [Aspergillus sclerotialis]|uniref:L-serine ammonia-lyase n=1 Tax=Aspergillus sclerotialis TaxID=2070753 RepID=A0A3A2ZVQ6_9EURO|nr:l-serine dehydratase [Aspergillus sclerotialis]